MMGLYRLLGACLVVLTAVEAQSFGVVDLEKIMSEAKLFVSAHQSFQHKRESFEAKLKQEERKLANQEESLKELKKKSPDSYAEEHKKFEKSLQALYHRLQKRKAILKNSYESELSRAQKVMNDVLQKIAKDKKLAIILNKKDTFVIDESLDFTNEVIDALNKKQDALS